MSDTTSLLLKSAIGKMADELLEREQFHLRVNAETGEVRLRMMFYELGWDDMPTFLRDPRLQVPPYGRVWVHVE